MAILTKQDILNKKDMKTKTIEVPEWGGEVIISTITGESRDRFETSVFDASGKMNSLNLRAKLVAACLVDEKGELLFKESDIKVLGRKSGAALDRLFSECQVLNSLGNAEIEALSKN